MKKLTIKMSALLLFIFIAACNTGNRNDRAVDSIEDLNDSMSIASNNVKDNPEAMDQLDDTSFAIQAADAGMTEIALGNLAQQKAGSKQIKDFGEMMVKDHTKANEELITIVENKPITLPNSPSEKHMEQISLLESKTGAEFDSAFSDMMLMDHDKAVKLFEKASSTLKDTQLKEYAAKTLPTLEEHLKHAKKLVTNK